MKRKMNKLAWMAIPLTQGLFALVDGKNFEWLNQCKWFAVKVRNNFYAARQSKWLGKEKRFEHSMIFMHREILGLKYNDNRQSDHKNHSGLDNREFNLRIVTVAQNQQNGLPHKDGKSKYKGVYWDKNAKNGALKLIENFMVFILMKKKQPKFMIDMQKKLTGNLLI